MTGFIHTSRRRVNPGVDLVILGLLLYGLAMFAASFIHPGAVANDLSQFSGAGDPTAEITARFAAIAGRARLAAFILIGLAVAGFTQRRHFDAFVHGRTRAGRWALRANIVADSLRARPMLATAALAVMAAGIALRLYYLDRPMRHDEAWTYMVYARMPLYAIPVRYSDVNDHVLNTFLIHICTSLFGNSTPIIRLPALLFGFAVMPAGFLLARALAGARAGVIAAALLASSVPLIEFSVNARGYEALTCFFLVILLAGHRALTRGNRAAWAAVCAAGTLGLYTVPTMAVPLVAAFCWFGLLAMRHPGPGRAAALIDIVAAGTTIIVSAALLYLPIFIANGPDVLLHSQGIHSSSGVAAAMMALPHYAVDIFRHWTRAYGVLPAALVLAALPASLMLARGARGQVALLFVALAVAVIFQLVLLKDVGPYRIWLPFLAALLVVAAIGLDGAIARAGAALRLTESACGAAAAGVALALCGTIGAGTLSSDVILASDETAYYPQAQIAATSLRTTTARDTIGITAVRSDEILYYALRDGIVLRPIFTGADLRYFRRVPPQKSLPSDPPGALILLVDGAFNDCRAASCGALARPDIKFGPILAVMRDDPDLTLLHGALQ